jgi:iron complex outermembrane receptor protein
MTFRTLSAHSAARHSIVSTHSFSTRALMMGLLLTSVSTVAFAQDVPPPPPPSNGAIVPGSANTSQQEQTNSNAPTAPSPMPPAPQADQVANPQTGSTVIENGPQAPQDQGLGAIIVTATKRETNLQQTPIAISVANAQSLQDRHALSLFSLADGSIPSLRVATFEARQSALTVGIRGIVPYDANQTARDNGVTVYLDGIALGKTQGLNAALMDIDRIEVLKGPQGTLFGRNTEGGAVSMITRAPTGVFGLRGTVGVGNYNSHNVDLHLDLPAFANIAIKLDGVWEHQNPTTKDPLTGSTGWNYYDRKGGRAAARWTPFDGFTADFAYDYAKDDNTPQYSQLIDYNPNNYPVGVYGATSASNAAPRLFVAGTYTVPGTGTPCGGTINTGSATPICIAPKAAIVGVHPDRQSVADIGVPQQPSVDITHGFMSNLKYKVTPHLELRSITAWRGVSTDQWDNSGGPERVTFAPMNNAVPGSAAAFTSGLFSRYSLSFLRQHQFSQEFQIVGSIPQLDYVLGAYYYTDHATEYAATPSSNQWDPGLTGTGYIIRTPIIDSSQTGVISSNNSGYQQYAPTCNNTLSTSVPQFTNSCQFITRASQAHDHNYSVFGQATFTPGAIPILHITGGARWTLDKRHGTLYVVNNLPEPFCFTNRANRVDPLLTVALDAAPTVHLYAKYSTGFRAGGANDRSLAFNPFGPESVKAYEAGAKMDFFDHKARLNLAGYVMDRKNTQFDFDLYDANSASPTFNSHIEQTVNAGTSKIKGFEADFTVRPVSALTLGASYAYTWWRAPSAVNPITGGPAQQLYIVYTPKNAAAGYIDYEVPTNISNGKLRFHADANYADGQYSFQLEPVKTQPSFIVNARIALADVELNSGSTLITFALWSRNLFNEQHIYRRSNANSSPVLNYCPTSGLVGATACTPNTLFSTNYGGILGDYANFNPPRTWGAEISFKIGAPHIPPAPYVAPPPPPPPATVTCESGTVITAPGVCPPLAPPPPPPPAPAPERG